VGIADRKMAKQVKKPLIGVTGPDRGGFMAWNFTRFMLFLSEANAVRITPSHKVDASRLDGLVVGGGSDIDPRLYGEKRDPRTAHIDHKRDKMEWKLIEQLYRQKKPMLGICRGMQMLNVYLGGTLNQHILDMDLEYTHQKSPLPHKIIFIKPHTLLYSILKVRKCEVNSIHHQAVEKLGKGLLVSAEDKNRIVQAIEHTAYPFLLGVQWHPEYMPQSLLQRRLFKAFVDHTKGKAAL
jgi:putative glutamine amidotransferase